jgi:hypothetical protein
MAMTNSIQQIIKNPPRKIALVVIEKIALEWHYRRLAGRTMTNHVITDAPLRAGEITQFRTNPAAFIALFTVIMSKVEEK